MDDMINAGVEMYFGLEKGAKKAEGVDQNGP